MSAPAEAAPPAAAPAHAAPRSSLMKVAAIVVVVMVVEGAVMFLMLPRGGAGGHANGAASGHAAASHGDGHGGGHGAAHGSGHGGGHSEEHMADDSGAVEIPIDAFMCTNNRASPGSIVHLTFKLTAIVPVDQQVAFERAVNGTSKARVRQAIVKVARSSSMEDLSDPDLSTVKRLFREEMNKAIRKSHVVEVVISDFKTLIQ